MQETHNGAGVIFTTATPITNTLGEQFVMTRYLARDILNKCNINNFDDWAANFAEPVTRMEYATDGVTISQRPRWQRRTRGPGVAANDGPSQADRFDLSAFRANADYRPGYGLRSKRLASRTTPGMETGTHSARGLRWPGSQSRKFKSWPATRRSACRPATHTSHQRSQHPRQSVSCNQQALPDRTCTKTCTRRKWPPIHGGHFSYKSYCFRWCPEGDLNPHGLAACGF